MKVILLESTNNVGMVGEVVNVKPGFARNFLFPKKKAVVANDRSMKAHLHQKKVLDHRVKKAKEEATKFQSQIHQKEINVVKKSSGAKKLFGSVTSLDVQGAITTQLGLTINRKSIVMEDIIKQIGSYVITLKLDGGLEALLTLHVKAEDIQPTTVVEGESPAKKERKSKKQPSEEVTSET